MARPLTPISRERINEYKLKIENAIKENDKQALKETKRLFMVYVKKRGKKITDFRRYAIYKYFKDREKPTQINVWKNILKRYKKININKLEYKEDKAFLKKDLMYLSEKVENLENKKYRQRHYRKRVFIKRKLQEKYENKYNWEMMIEDYFRRGLVRVCKSYFYFYNEVEVSKREIIELAKKFEGIIQKYDEEYDRDIEKENSIKLYIIEKTNKEAGYDCTEWINDYFKGKLSYADKELFEAIEECVNEYKEDYMEKIIPLYAVRFPVWHKFF